MNQQFRTEDKVRIYLEHCNVTTDGVVTHCAWSPAGEWLYLVALMNGFTMAVTAQDLEAR